MSAMSKLSLPSDVAIHISALALLQLWELELMILNSDLPSRFVRKDSRMAGTTSRTSFGIRHRYDGIYRMNRVSQMMNTNGIKPR
jgi:hypothetical protein